MNVSPAVHPLAAIVAAAATGTFPTADGGWSRVPVWRPGVQAIVAFTGHAFFAVTAEVSDDRLSSLGANGLGGAHDPRLITALAGEGGWIDSLDCLLVSTGTGADDRPGLVRRHDLALHPRVALAMSLRDDVSVWGYPDPAADDIAVVSRGVAGLWELSFEIAADRRGAGAGTAIVRVGRSAIPAAELVVAAVAPGNAASLRALLGAGFTPVASIQLFRAEAPSSQGSGG